MKLSNRAINVQASPIRKLMPFANEAKKKGKKIYHLNIGQPDIETPREMLDVYKNYEDNKNLDVSHPFPCICCNIM